MKSKKAPSKQSGEDRHKSSRMVRVDGELYGQLEELAARNERPAKWELERAIRAHVARSTPGGSGEDRQ